MMRKNEHFAVDIMAYCLGAILFILMVTLVFVLSIGIADMANDVLTEDKQPTFKILTQNNSTNESVKTGCSCKVFRINRSTGKYEEVKSVMNDG